MIEKRYLALYFALIAPALAAGAGSLDTGAATGERVAIERPAPERAAPRRTLDQAVTDGCVACHRGPLSLESWVAAELAVRIADIKAGRRSHPMPIPDLGDTELRELAEALAGS